MALLHAKQEDPSNKISIDTRSTFLYDFESIWIDMKIRLLLFYIFRVRAPHSARSMNIEHSILKDIVQRSTLTYEHQWQVKSMNRIL